MYYMDTDRFIDYVKTEDIYTDISKHVETRFNTSNYELEIQLPKGINKKTFRLMGDELGRKKKFPALGTKTFSYLQ